MKNGLVIFLMIICAAGLVECASEKKIEYSLPDGLSDYDKKNMLVTLDAGKIYYKKYCSECHGIFANPTPGIPDFAKVRIGNMDKTIDLACRREPVAHAITLKMSIVEINSIMLFIKCVTKD